MSKKIIEFDNKRVKNKNSLDNKIKSDDLFDLAMEASSKTQAIKYAKEALEVYPDNIDAQTLIADFEESDIKRLKKYDAVIKNATEILEKDNMFDEENIGIFWGLIGTRPYMRLRHRKILVLMALGRYTEAIIECEDMLRLCENDNMGIRYLLVGLYCILERFDECEKLFSKYEDYSLHMVFPLAIMYFKKGDYKKAKEFLGYCEDANENIIECLVGNPEKVLEDDDMFEDYYSMGSQKEAALVTRDSMHLLGSVPGFLKFIIEEYCK